MEILLNVNDSATVSTVSTRFANSSFITTWKADFTETFKWTDAEISRLFQIIVRPILLVVGTVGNFVSFYVMRRTSLKDVSSCFYMSLLALVDTSG